jgi:hypothetical protein
MRFIVFPGLMQLIVLVIFDGSSSIGIQTCVYVQFREAECSCVDQLYLRVSQLITLHYGRLPYAMSN